MGALGAEGGGLTSCCTGRGASTEICDATLGAGVAGGSETGVGAAGTCETGLT